MERMDCINYTGFLYPSTQYKSIWIRIPKVASSSISVLLVKNNMVDKGFWTVGKKRKLKKGMYWNKAESLDILDYFKYCFVRNPYSRLLSTYKNRVLIHDNYKKFGITQKSSFKDFVYWACGLKDCEGDGHLLSQMAILKYKNKFMPEFVGKMENLYEDWNKILKKLGINSKNTMPHVKRTGAYEEVEKYYTKELIDLVTIRYKKDIEELGYEPPKLA